MINSKLINRTRTRVIDAISNIISSQCEMEIRVIFSEYISSNNFSEKDAEMFMKAYDYSEEKNSKKEVYIN